MYGGAIHVHDGTYEFSADGATNSSIVFHNNRVGEMVGYGGAMSNLYGTISLSDVIFTSNTAGGIPVRVWGASATVVPFSTTLER